MYSFPSPSIAKRIATWVAVLAVCQSHAAAQDTLAVDVDFQNAMIEQDALMELPFKLTDKMKKQVITNSKKRTMQTLGLQIDYIHRVCGIDPKQKLKLEIAAKGTAEEISNQLITRLEKSQKRFNEAAEKNADRKDGDGKKNNKQWNKGQQKKGQEIEDEAEFNPAEVQFMLVDMLATNSMTSNPTQNKRWKLSLQKVLTQPQQKKLAVADKTRIDKYRAAAITYASNSLRNKLMLSDEQTRKVETVIGQRIGNRILQNAKLPVGYTQDVRQMVYSIPPKKFESILSARQLAVWKATYNTGGAAFIFDNRLGVVDDQGKEDQQDKDK